MRVRRKGTGRLGRNRSKGGRISLTTEARGRRKPSGLTSCDWPIRADAYQSNKRSFWRDVTFLAGKILYRQLRKGLTLSLVLPEVKQFEASACEGQGRKPVAVAGRVAQVLS